MMHYLLYPGADPVFHIRGVNCSAFSLFPLLSIPSLLLSSLFPPLSFHLFSLFCPPTFTPFPSSSLNPGEALPNQIRGSGKHYEPPAGPGGARPTNYFWCILCCKALSTDNTIDTSLHKSRGEVRQNFQSER